MSAVAARRRLVGALQPAAEVIDIDSDSNDDDDVPLLHLRCARRARTPAAPPPPAAAGAVLPAATPADSDGEDLVVVSARAAAPAADAAPDVAVVPPPAAPPPPAAGVALDGDDGDGAELVATTQHIHVYPHGRADCAAHRFVPAVTAAAVVANRATCDKCFCYVCDVAAADCADWGVHCMAHAGSEAWRAVRSRKKRRLALQITAELFVPGAAVAGRGRGGTPRGGGAPPSGRMAAAAAAAAVVARAVVSHRAAAAPAAAHTVSPPPPPPRPAAASRGRRRGRRWPPRRRDGGRFPSGASARLGVTFRRGGGGVSGTSGDRSVFCWDAEACLAD